MIVLILKLALTLINKQRSNVVTCHIVPEVEVSVLFSPQNDCVELVAILAQTNH